MTIYRRLFLIGMFLILHTLHAAEEKPFAVVVVGHNDRDFVQQNLESIFHQKYPNFRVIYIADAPMDGTEKQVREAIEANNWQERVCFLHNKESKGFLACMAQAVYACNKEEIVVELAGCDWLAHDDVLSQLNALYADPDVWATYGNWVEYPSSDETPSQSIKDSIPRARTYYAALFHQIDKEHLLCDGRFISSCNGLAYFYPIQVMADKHCHSVADPLVVMNQINLAFEEGSSSTPSIEWARSIALYSALPKLPIAPSNRVYSYIEDILHPTLYDYRFIQSYLATNRKNMIRLGDYEERARSTQIIGVSDDEIPQAGMFKVKCAETDRENCIILYATYNKNYPRGLRRLLKNIFESDYKGHVLYRFGGWPNEEGGSLVLAHVPYAFKVCFFKEAQRLGFKRVLWIDTSMLPVASLNDVFAMIKEKGYFAMGNAHQVGPFMNSQAAAFFGLTLEQTYRIPSCSSGIFGLDLTQMDARNLLDLWYRSAQDSDAYYTPRPDQNSLSLLLHQFHFNDLIPIERMPIAMYGQEIKPDSLFYLDWYYVQ